MLTQKEIIHLKYNSNSQEIYVEDKDFITKRIEEMELSKKEIGWTQIAERLKTGAKMNILKKNKKKKVNSK